MAGIFKTYDIRGVVNQGLTSEVAYLIGRGLAQEVFEGQGPIVVSRDMRVHSPVLSAALERGLTTGGCAVVDIGLAATPMNYWANTHYGSRGSVTVTASHNGPEYNGFKVSGANATPLDYGTGLNLVERFVQRAQGGALPAPVSPPGKPTLVPDALGAYLDFMDPFLHPSRHPLKIGVDTANGMGGFFLPEFFARHPELEPVALYWELDGAFPNHEADPLKPENLLDVQALVKEHHCDFGVAYDGDADRCMFVDETGTSVASDLITALIAGTVLARNPGSPILYDLRSSKIVPEWITQHGGVPVRNRVGHSFMKRSLKAQQAPFGGELSGHYYFADCFYTDSGLMAMLQVINICRERAQPLSQLIAPLRKYSATGEINFQVPDAQAILERVGDHYGPLGAQLDHLDGLTVDLGSWWFNLRSSNTEPLLRLNLEAPNATARAARLDEVKTLIGV